MRSKHHYEFVLGRFVGFDQEHKQVKLEARQYAKQSTETTQFELNYDTFESWQSVRPLTTLRPKALNITAISSSVASKLKFSSKTFYICITDAQNRPETRALNIAITGAGATGVSSLQPNWSMRKVPFFKYGLNKIDPNKVKVTLIEAADAFFPPYPPKWQHTPIPNWKNLALKSSPITVLPS